MKVLEAVEKGMCFGVRDALDVALRTEAASEVTVWGELVHNEAVLAKLRDRGFAMRGEAQREELPETTRVLVTAHGVSDAERRRLEHAGKVLIDTTCPLVRRVHEAARRLHDEGRLVVVIGKPGHVEVRGIVGDLARFAVVPERAAVRPWNEARIGVVCQSTVQEDVARDVLRAIEERNPESDVRYVDTICSPTKQRILALEALLPECDAVVVVGGRHSNNTRQLVQLCSRRGVRAVHVQGAADLQPAWFAGCRVVGLTAGTSTLDDTIAEVRRALARIPGDERAAPAASRTKL